MAGNHVVQLVVPFGLFLPQPIAGISALLMMLTQGWLVLTGNFSWLNAVTLSLAVAAIPDGALSWLPVEAPADLAGVPGWLAVVVVVLGLAVAAMSWWPVRNMASPAQRMNASFNSLHLVNTYGAFGSITRTRYEIVIEGTRDPHPGPGSDWHPYGFRGKPGDPARRPPQIAPYHLRLDWQMRFAAMAPRPRRRWFLRFVERLLEADPAVLGLLRTEPFDGRPPTAVRAVRYRYRFTTPEERRRAGAWWIREREGVFLRPVTADGR